MQNEGNFSASRKVIFIYYSTFLFCVTDRKVSIIEICLFKFVVISEKYLKSLVIRAVFGNKSAPMARCMLHTLLF